MPRNAAFGRSPSARLLASIALAALAIIAAFTISGCSKDDDPESPIDPGTPDDTEYRASGTVTSTTSGSFTTTSGAKIVVPEGAVPPTAENATGTMSFSIERDAEASPSLPDGAALASTVYRFGPEGFVFGKAVEVSVPVTGSPSPESVQLFRINPTTGESEAYGGVYDPATGRVSAQTYQLSSWFAAVAPWAYACLRVENGSGEWVSICAEQVTLRFPVEDANFEGAGSVWCGGPGDCIYWASTGPWYLPQGTYRFCVSAGGLTDGTIRHFFTDTITLDEPWTSTNPTCSSLVIGAIGAAGTLGTIAGPCECTPEFTASVGTGDLQVTLTWHSAIPLDLDLWVTDPSGERCFYNNPITVSGGQIDRDNRCGNYQDGRPENIFWTTAPAGEYRIEVDWYPCATSVTSMEYSVRVVNKGSARTYTGTITPNPRTIEVARVTVGSAKMASAFGDFSGVASEPREYPAKD